MAGEIEARFIALMSELFQLDEAEALDFGLYRVIRRHNHEVRAFLGEIVGEGEAKHLQGGQLQAYLDQAFDQANAGGREAEARRLTQLESVLKINAGMPASEQESQLAKAAEFRPDDVAEYRSLKDSLNSSQNGNADRAEVLNRLYQFFSRHYQDGDFIVERRYGKGGARYVKSTGEDTEFHWATEDMYYIKSGDIFTDFPVRLANGQRLVFSVEPESLKATREALKPNDKAHYELANVVKDGDVLRVTLNYQKGTKGADAKKDVIVEAAQRAGAGSGEESAKGIKYWLKCFINRNQSDFFIHKRLKVALTDDLDIFLKTEVLDADQLLAGGDIPKRAIQVARIVREVGGHIIDFLAVLEDFQKSLWEKKKLVLETRYVITLDRLARHAPEWLAQNIDSIIEKQRQEWQDLGLGEYRCRADCVHVTVGDMATPSTEQYFPLPVDTLHFDAAFKWSMLEAVTAATVLDDALDGIAINSDNWQALNVLQKKYGQKIQTLYADPPYNTDAGPIDYKNGYRKGSWAALIYDRFVLSRNLLQIEGIACATIDDYQQRELHTIMEMIFGVDNRVGTVAIRANPRGRPTKTGLAVAHEYAIFFRNDPSSVLDKVERTAKQQERYRVADEQGVFEWMNFRRQGSNSDRSARWRLYYPIFLTKTSLRIPKIIWNEEHKEWELHEKPKQGEVVVYPIDEEGNQKTWRWKHDEVTANPDEFQVKDDRSDRRWVYFKYRPNQKGVQATTIWSDARHSATEYGTAIVKKLFGKSAFSYPKSLLAVQDCLKVAGLRDDEGWCIDIFAGSGTTAHAVMAMNADDGGNRKFILV